MKQEILSESSIELLLEVIQNYDFLFDLSHRDYKNSKEKDDAWREIAEIVGMTGKGIDT